MSGEEGNLLTELIEWMNTEECPKQFRLNVRHIAKWMDEPNVALIRKLKKKLGLPFIIRLSMNTGSL